MFIAKDLGIIEETDKYIVSRTEMRGAFDTEEMLTLHLKINGVLVFVRNYGQYCHDILETHKAHFDLGRGYFSIYGNDMKKPLAQRSTDNYGKGDPVEELQDKLEMVTFSKLERSEFYAFSGNHADYSGAFFYLIWDKKIIDKVRAGLVAAGLLEVPAQ